MRIAMVGTRGIPAAYGGFETAVEEVGKRLASRGHEVLVYCRGTRRLAEDDNGRTYLGMRLCHLPALRNRQLETLSHTAFSVLHLVTKEKVDAVLLFNAANSVFLPLLHSRGLHVATHVDGLEWQRGKWGRIGKHYYRLAECLAVRWSDRLIADAAGIAHYYKDEFGAATDLIAYGAPVLINPSDSALSTLGLTSGGYHLVVARCEPENHVDMIIDGYRRSAVKMPLIVVGSAPYSTAYTKNVSDAADASPGVRLIGSIWDHAVLNQLYAHAATYVHGHSVGGTNPSLLRAMGAGTASIAYDVNFNRDVLGEQGRYFHNAAALGRALRESESNRDDLATRGAALALRAASLYNWDAVALAYEDLCLKLAEGRSQRGAVSGRRKRSAPSSSRQCEGPSSPHVLGVTARVRNAFSQADEDPADRTPLSMCRTVVAASVGRSPKGQHFGVVDNPIDNRRRNHLLARQGTSARERQVGGQGQ